MERYDKKGMMIFPVPDKIKKAGSMADVVVIGQCFCPNGHNLVTAQICLHNEIVHYDGMGHVMFK